MPAQYCDRMPVYYDLLLLFLKVALRLNTSAVASALRMDQEEMDMLLIA